jgi:uncharacterized protein involved in exopolysaccharide biosynthesis
MKIYPQFTIDEILAVLRRRKIFIIFPFIIISAVCISGAFLLPQKYKSSITISVQKDAVLNPLVSYTMAVAYTSDDRLRDFNEIIYSRPAIEALIDSLGLNYLAVNEKEKEKLVEEIRERIETNLRGSDSFTIDFFDPVPARAQIAARILSELFIEKRLEVNNKRNELAVEFFENKLSELRNKFEENQQEYIASIKEQMDVMPTDDYGLYSRVDKIASDIGIIDEKVERSQSALNMLRNATNDFTDRTNIETYHNVALLDVPYAEELRTHLNNYEDLSKKYTSNFPGVRDLQLKISNLTERIKNSLESELTRQQNHAFSLQRERGQTLGTIRSATVHKNQNADVRATYDVYNQLYNEMKIKLEQARTNRDLGAKGSEQFVVIDPPQLPTEPAKPNKLLLIGGGIVLGLFVGFLSAGFMELFDTRIRTSHDVEMYEKPILAYLPAPNSKY